MIEKVCLFWPRVLSPYVKKAEGTLLLALFRGRKPLPVPRGPAPLLGSCGSSESKSDRTHKNLLQAVP